jgi:uncharacterized protein
MSAPLCSGYVSIDVPINVPINVPIDVSGVILSFQIWVDADACPNIIKEILFRAATRTSIKLTLVANNFIKTPKSASIQFIQVPGGFDVADNEIVRRSQPGDLVITSDIPLAAELIDKNVQALSPRGELFTADNIRPRLNIRDFMDTMRSSGVQTGGPPPIGQTEKQNFANALDRIMTRAIQAGT